MHITSYGAADGVTGSCHLLEVAGEHILLDCGLFQGGKSSREKNHAEFEFNPELVHTLIVSHAHLDHIGRIPLLYKAGFRGRIISTRATFELARISLMDSASLMSSKAERKNRNRSIDEREEPLYDEDDVFEVLDMWSTFVEYHKPFSVTDSVEATFYDAGHILGSAFIELKLDEDGEEVSFVFSGDIGNLDKPIIKDPETAPTADVAMVETTYGDRDHRPFDKSIEELEAAICETWDRGGNVVIPTFALERAQELLYVLYTAWRDGRIPEKVKIFLDSPMAISATRIFERHPDLYDSEALELKGRGETPFHFPRLAYTRETRESIEINRVSRGGVILAGSGMVTGGRVLHHLIRNLPRSECSVVFCGFQAYGTTGRYIVDGNDFVKLYGEVVPVEAKIYTINGFSAHAGQRELTDWVRNTGAKTCLLVHGEDDAQETFAKHVMAQTQVGAVHAMQFGEAVDLIEAAKNNRR